MKYFGILVIGVLSQRNRRFNQLTDMMKKHNAKFNVYKNFAYGCNCNLLATGGDGDKPLTQPGWGQAVDKLDSVCKTYKGCLQCVVESYGSQCIGELVAHNFSWGNPWNGEKALCTDAPGTCSRALCECDSTFALTHGAVVDQEYNEYYSHFFLNFKYEAICPNLCHTNSFFLDTTESYTGNTNLNGEYTVLHKLVNDYKCYVNGNNQIVHENDVFGKPAWVIYEGTKKVFYGTTDTVCPKDVSWVFIRDNSKVNNKNVSNIGFNGLSRPDIMPGKLGLDEQCCPSLTGPHTIYNAYTNICCSNGETPHVGNLCP